MPVKGFIPSLQTFTSTDFIQDWMGDINKFILATNKVSPLKTANFTCTMLDYYYPVNNGNAFVSVVATLPPAVGIIGKPYFFRALTGGGTVTITPSGTDTIEGAATKVVAIGSGVKVRSDGVSIWYVE